MAYKYNMATGVSKIKRLVKTRLAAVSVIASSVAMLAVLPLAASAAANNTNKGFDQYGYNDNARVFVGDCLNWYNGKYPGTTVAQAQAYCGDYAKDQVVMKWNKAWDDCNATTDQNDSTKCAGAWVTNEWNGNVPGGSGETEHYKIIWVGSEGQKSPYWRDGGKSIWGNYEIVMDQGVAGGAHSWNIHATPADLGRD